MHSICHSDPAGNWQTFEIKRSGSTALIIGLAMLLLEL